MLASNCPALPPNDLARLLRASPFGAGTELSGATAERAPPTTSKLVRCRYRNELHHLESKATDVTYRGSCHCGALAVRFRSQKTLQLRACQCSFCRRHHSASASDPEGHIRFLVRRPEALQRYQFGAGVTDFILCNRCGCYLGAMLADQKIACVNVRSWQESGEALPVDYQGESPERRLERRRQRWSPADLMTCEQTFADEGLIDEYLSELNELLGGFDPQRSVSAQPEEMAPPQGVFLLIKEGDQPLACGGMKTFAPGIGEIKRMYTRPRARGRGLAQDLLEELEENARSLKMHRLLLDTASPLEAATRLYLRSGYQEVEAYNDNPYAARWFAKDLL